MIQAFKRLTPTWLFKLGTPASSDGLSGPGIDLEAGRENERPDTQSAPVTTTTESTTTKEISEKSLIYEKDPARFSHLKGVARLRAEYITYINRGIHRRHSGAGQLAIFYLEGHLWQLENKILDLRQRREQGQVVDSDDPDNDEKELAERLVTAKLRYDDLILKEKAIQELPNPTCRQLLALLNTLVHKVELKEEDYEFLLVADDSFVSQSGLAYRLADRFIHEWPHIFERIGLSLPTPSGSHPDIDGERLRKTVAVLLVLGGVLLSAAPIFVMILVPMSLAAMLALTLVTVLVVSVVVALASPQDTLRNQILVVAAMMAVMVAVATLKAESAGWGG